MDITLIGAGLVGSLLSRQLATRGFRVTVFEKRPDPRLAGFDGGRSINLALAERGLHALRQTGLADDVLRKAVMMRGRMVHTRDARPVLQRYGVDDSEVIWSVSRNGLNTLLLDAAEAAGVRFHFGQSLVGADFNAQRLHLVDEHGHRREVDAPLVIGADGAGSALRAAMNAHSPLGERVEPLDHAYKELEIPPAAQLPAALQARAGGRDQFVLEPHALHIWPHGGYMCIALPNIDGSFTVTLFLPALGPYPSFASVTDAHAAQTLFRDEFPDLVPLLPTLATDYDAHPVGSLATLYLQRWHLDGRAVLVGDAAHAIVPFHGQGMNSGFEDTVTLAALLAGSPRDSAGAFVEFQRIRQPNADAIAALSLENYVEMRDSVADPHYLARQALGARLAERAPTHFMTRYRMVGFTHLPYAYAYERGHAQDDLLDQLLRGSTDASTVDLDAAVTTLITTLPPLPSLRHAG